MQETLLLFHMDKDLYSQIEKLATQLNVHLQIIEDEQVCQTIGYILNMEGFDALPTQQTSLDFNREFMFFAGMSDQQIDIFLQLMKMNQIPPIPYKAMLTKHNIHYTFEQLYQSVQDEYQQMSQMNTKKS